MSAKDAIGAPSQPAQRGEQDLGPLAWVLEELRKTLDAAMKSLRHFVHEADATGASDLASHDTAALRGARQGLHQCGGALEMVGMESAALVLHAMEAAAQRFMLQPEHCSAAAVETLERASFAVLEYLENVLVGKAVSPVALFPQYRQVQLLAGVERVHPADLWSPARRVHGPVDRALAVSPVEYGPQARARLDRAVLRIVKSGDAAAAADMQDLCTGLAAAQVDEQVRGFWQIGAGFFEALARGAVVPDAYVKRVTSRVLMHYAMLARGEAAPDDTVLQELLFYCAQAGDLPGGAEGSPLAAVRRDWGLADHQPVGYETPRFGLFDPVLLAQARKRIATATETWSALAGGDRQKIKPAADQFSLVCDSLHKLHLDSEPLADALMHAVAVPLHTGQPPSTALAMEVATAVLYLQASLEELDTSREHMAERAARLAERLAGVTGGGESQPLEPWMEELYRRVSDQQTMGSVVDELRATLAGTEKSLDQFFRDPADTSALVAVPGSMQQMRGVLSVLGLDQASLAVLRMRELVERLIVGEVPDEERAQVFGRLGNSLGALGFLIDMLGYQRAMARKLFVFDEELGELRILMGRARAADRPGGAPRPPVAHGAAAAPGPTPEPPVRPVEMPALPTLPDLPAAESPAVTADVPSPDRQPEQESPSGVSAPDPELLEIFLDEAREVVAIGQGAVQALTAEPEAQDGQAALRRVFHTLKGSSRMVGLGAFGDAAWAMEELLNTWLAEQRPTTQSLLDLSTDALQALGRWVEDLAAGGAQGWSAQGFSASADALRRDGAFVPLEAAGAREEAAAGEPADGRAPAAVAQAPEPSPEDVYEGHTLPSELADDAAIDFPDTVLDGDAEEPVTGIEAEADLALIDFALTQPAGIDDEERVIGDLRVPAALYNVYLNEADEWSRRLDAALHEWSPDEPLSEDAEAMAHSLAGSSATVGFAVLSNLARTLEHALQHLRLGPAPAEDQVQALTAASAEIRRLLHQFAAGFLKEPQPRVLEQLQALLQVDVASAAAPLPDAEPGETPGAPPVWEPAAAEAGDAFEREQAIDAAIVRAVAADEGDDDIDVVDVIDLDLFPIFEEEAQELLPALGAALRQWSARPEDMVARGELLRALHTLKGSARLAGALRLGEMAHRMESAVERVDLETAGTGDIEPLLARLDGLQANFDVLRAVGEQSLAEPAPASEPAQAAPVDRGALPAAAALPAIVRAPAIQTVVHGAVRPAAGQQVRVRSQLLDRLVNDAGEVLIARARLAAQVEQMRGSLQDLSGNLERLRTQLRDIEVQAETQMQSRQAQSRDSAAGFDPLEFDRFTRMQELTRMMAESVNDVATVQRALQRSIEVAEDNLTAQGRQARELQRDLLRTRMVEFDAIAERLYAVVRQAARETGKQVRLDIEGGVIEVDRGVLERMTPAFEHLLRNCVAHGIEGAQERAAAGKPPVGAITVRVGHEGNDISVEFRDDGAGLDVERIRQRALAQGLVAADEAIDPAQAGQLIFLPGFSTADEVTELSGRGIGMDVVRSEVQGLGGRIETETAPGQGTAFRMVLPLTTAVTQVVMVRVGSLSVGIAANVIEVVRRATRAELEAAYASGSYQDLPLYWAGALLQASVRSTETGGKTCPVVVVRSASQRLALHVDQVLGNQEVVVKNLGPQLSRLPGLSGMSVLASGAVVLIYNPVALASVYGEWARSVTLPPGTDTVAAPALEQPAGLTQSSVVVPLVLVVDDSITVRRVTQRLLQREGYRVALAADGLQALERLREERPAVVLSDIEMPRMDGFDLARAIRGDAALAGLPIVMITSRMAEKHKQHAAQLGVNHYLGKPYSDEALLALVRHFAAHVAPLAGA